MAILTFHRAECLETHSRTTEQDPPRHAGRKRAFLRIALGVLSTLILLSPGTGTQAQTEGASAEYLVKAAFIYNIAKFVEWPGAGSPDNRNPIALCVVGNSFGPAINSVEGKQVRGRALTIKQDPSISEAKDCQLLFISEARLAERAAFLAAVKDRPALTLCDTPRCAEQGFMVNLQLTDNKVGLEINANAVQRSPIKISAQLMKLARLAKEER